MKRSRALLLGALAAALPIRAYAQVVTDPLGLSTVGTEGEGASGKPVCASNGGATSGCIVGASTTGSSTSDSVGIAGTGPASGDLIGVTGTGSATSNLVGISLAGPSNTNLVSASGTGPADASCTFICVNSSGTASVSGTGSAGMSGCPNSLIAVSGAGSACASSVAVSGTGEATGAWAVSGTGRANGSGESVEGMCLPVACGYGSASLEFSVGGTLDPFPGTQQPTNFTGTGTGAGTATGLGSDGGDYHADFVINSMAITGSAQYNEPAWPICPLTGSAIPLTGQISGTAPSGSVTGVIYGANGSAVGSVTSLTTTFAFAYNRVGATATLVITGGWSYIGYSAGGRTGVLTTSYVGSGAAAFVADPNAAESACRAGSGSLPYTLTGTATVAG